MYDLVEVQDSVPRTVASFASPYAAVDELRRRARTETVQGKQWRVLDLDGQELFGPDDLDAIGSETTCFEFAGYEAYA